MFIYLCYKLGRIVSMYDAGFGNKGVSIAQRRYLGSKTKLLNFIDNILVDEGVQFNSFADIFAGTGVVANHFFSRSNVVVNDLLESNYHCHVSFFGRERVRSKLLHSKIENYNSITVSDIPDNYFSENFANTYFDADNSRKIGYIREDIETMFNTNEINERERSYLICSLIYALDRIANTVGHYDAYRKVDIPKKQLVLRPLVIGGNKNSAK